MQEYPGGKGYKYGFTLLYVAMAGLSVWIILNSEGNAFTLVGGVLMQGFCKVAQIGEAYGVAVRRRFGSPSVV